MHNRLVKIAICTPHLGETKAKYSQSLGRLISFTGSATLNGPDGPIRPEIDVFMKRSAIVSHARRVVAQQAMAWEPDWLLWIDADQVFPRDALIKLLMRGMGMIAAIVRLNNAEARESNAARLVDGKPEPVFPSGDGIEEVLYVGLAFCLVHSSIMKALTPPLFREDVPEGAAGFMGEDAYFCRKVSAAGFPIYVDHALSVGHVTETVLTF